MVADDGQMEESWRVASTAAGTLSRWTSENPLRVKLIDATQPVELINKLLKESIAT